MEILTESTELPLESVLLSREWTFWENYESKERTDKKNWSSMIQDVFTFNTLIDFWQFWNIYPGADPSEVFYNGERMRYFFKKKLRIIAMNLFVKDVRPEWEDERNKNGKIFTLEYVIENKVEIDVFMQMVQKEWVKLMLSLIGENLFQSEYINGIRFVDKTQIGRKILFRFEIWFNAELPEESVKEIKEKYGKEFGCPGISMKPIQ